jgi:hypothetical protein
MADFHYAFEVRSSPERIWSVLLDVERWPEWTPTVTRVTRLEIGPLTLGSRARLTQPRLSPAVWCVTSLDERRRFFAWSTHSIGVNVIARHQVESHGLGSRVSLSLSYSGFLGPIMAALLSSLNWDYLRKEGDGLRLRCESTPLWPAATQ